MNRLNLRSCALGLSILMAACSPSADESLAQGRAAFDDHRYVDAREALIQGLESDPGNKAMIILLAQAKLRLNDPDGARATLSRLPVSEADLPQVRLLRAEAFLRSENRDRALKEVEGMRTPASLYILAMASLPEDPAVAEQAFIDGAAMEPSDARLLSTYALFELMRGDIAKAQQLLVRAQSISPSDYDVLMASGEIAINSNNEKAAIAYYEKASQLYPDSQAAKLAYADMLVANGQSAKGVAIVREIVGTRVPSGDAAYILAKDAVGKGNWEEVRRLLQPISGRGLPDQRLLYADALVHLGLYNLALAELDPMKRILGDHELYQDVLARAMQGDAVADVSAH